VVTLLWLAFGAALVTNPGILDSVWQSFRGLPLLVQLVVGLLLLPWVVGLWIWESGWPLWLRLLLMVGLGVATVMAFFPRRA
jgi:hypothetical protein